jgi:hypothetical protein
MAKILYSEFAFVLYAFDLTKISSRNSTELMLTTTLPGRHNPVATGITPSFCKAAILVEIPLNTGSNGLASDAHLKVETSDTIGLSK